VQSKLSGLSRAAPHRALSHLPATLHFTVPPYKCYSAPCRLTMTGPQRKGQGLKQYKTAVASPQPRHWRPSKQLHMHVTAPTQKLADSKTIKKKKLSPYLVAEGEPFRFARYTAAPKFSTTLTQDLFRPTGNRRRKSVHILGLKHNPNRPGA
jgi:hypothetical protein